MKVKAIELNGQCVYMQVDDSIEMEMPPAPEVTTREGMAKVSVECRFPKPDKAG